MQNLPGHHVAFNTLKSALMEAPILHYPDPSKYHIVYTDAPNDACGAQLLQEHNGQKLPVAFSPTYAKTPSRNGALQTRKPMAFTMLYQSRTTIYRDLTLLYVMITNPYRNF